MAGIIDEVVDGFIKSLNDDEIAEFCRFIPNQMIKQKIDFFDLVVSRLDLRGQGQWVVKKLAEEYPIESSLLTRYDDNGVSLLDWEAGFILKRAKEKLQKEK